MVDLFACEVVSVVVADIRGGGVFGHSTYDATAAVVFVLSTKERSARIHPARLWLAGWVSRWGWLLVHRGEAIVSAMSFEIPEQTVIASPDVVGELRRHQSP